MDIYLDLATSIKDDYVNERWCNFLAVSAMLKRSKKFDVSDDIANRIRAMSQAESTSTYEQLYNIADWLIATGDIPAATACLQESESKIKMQLDDPDMADDPSLKTALCAVRTQLAYIGQLIGKPDQALKQYKEVFQQKPEDAAILAVVSNNIVTIHGAEQDVFDSRKKLKVATSEAARLKMNSEQFSTILYNQALFSLLTGQTDQAHEVFSTADRRYSDEVNSDEKWVLLKATASAKEKKLDEAVNFLKKAPKTVVTQMALIQYLLQNGAIGDACVALHGLTKNSEYAAGLVGCLTALYEKQNKLQEASQVLKEAIAFHKKHGNNTLCQNLIKAAASLNQRHSKLDVAAEFLEQLRRDFAPNDRNILAQLIAIYLRIDPKKAEKIGQSLPSLDEAAQEVDVAALEQIIIGGGKILKPKPQQPQATTQHTDSSQQAVTQKKKRNKKRKKPVIKNFIPNFVPDPERWLPKWQRSNYRGPKRRHRKGAVGVGTQGGSADFETEHSLGQQKATSSAPVTSSGPRQQKSGNRRRK